ncbi:putrescine hydroxycinnamoyltransferase 1-like [Panicum virgatum]|uniref:putrescine hydroxycinnamoyltransferase 1-like n=1 Tax=Panicum virgatum TaxID=38727 RepID=UPI0019D627FA|nr:putrescine hydroxycinnamoyltransferase 1-like [Panicum virgatum]
MASIKACNDWHVRVVSRRLVKASDTSIKHHVVTVSNLDIIARILQVSMFCVYAKPPAGEFDAVVAAFEAGLPSFLNHFFPLAGRIAMDNTSSGVPVVHCSNQGAELVVGEAGVMLRSLDYGAMGPSLQKIELPYGEDMALSVQVVSFACGGFTVAWRTNHVVVDGCALSSLVSAWSAFTRSGGTLPAAVRRPNYDRSIFRPRSPPSYSASLDAAFTPLDARCQVNCLTADHSSVLRF